MKFNAIKVDELISGYIGTNVYKSHHKYQLSLSVGVY